MFPTTYRFHAYVNGSFVKITIPCDGEARHIECSMEQHGYVETRRTWRNEGGRLRLLWTKTTWTNGGEQEECSGEEIATEFQHADGLCSPCYRTVEQPECGFIAWN